MLNKLPPEINNVIYSFLDQNDLHNILKVSKAFADAVIPAIWSTVWVDALQISGFRDANSIAQKALADCRINQPVSFTHERKRSYMFVGRSRLREFCYGLERGRYTYALSCVKTLNISLEYTLRESQVMGTLEECDELGLVHWLLEQIPRYFTGLTQLEILTESVTEEERQPGISRLDFNNVPTNLFMTIEHSHLARLGKVNFDNIRVLRLEITFQERLSYDLAKHFKGTLPGTVERLDLVNYAESSITVDGLIKFIKNCKRLRSLTLFTPVFTGSTNPVLEIPSLELLYLNFASSGVLKSIKAPRLLRLSLESITGGVNVESEGYQTLLQELGSMREVEELVCENVPVERAIELVKFSSARCLSIHGQFVPLVEDFDQVVKKVGKVEKLESVLIDIPHSNQVSESVLNKEEVKVDNFVFSESTELTSDKLSPVPNDYYDDGYSNICLSPRVGQYFYKIIDTN